MALLEGRSRESNMLRPVGIYRSQDVSIGEIRLGKLEVDLSCSFRMFPGIRPPVTRYRARALPKSWEL